MKKNERETIIDSTFFPYILIRDYLLKNILGDETNEILYWAGKELARQFPLREQEDVVDAFSHCGFGNLTCIKENASQAVYSLSGELVQTRLLQEQVSFELEAGFLAEQLAKIKQQNVSTTVRMQNEHQIELIAEFNE